MVVCFDGYLLLINEIMNTLHFSAQYLVEDVRLCSGTLPY
jgi:hypothetical protein